MVLDIEGLESGGGAGIGGGMDMVGEVSAICLEVDERLCIRARLWSKWQAKGRLLVGYM